ncbi:hypothetical protein LMH73_019325 [Vibrio splendidus]|nr:hypothetical protein [Vibrio splendidus]MCC4883231.1 hypothetical protein [Vibrio splendidus]
MRNKANFNPEYRMFDFKTAWMICDYDRKIARKAKGREINIVDKLINCIDIITGAHMDRFARVEFDYILVGSDHLLNAIVSSILAQKGKRVLIHAIPEFNLPSEYLELERLRFNLQNEMFCKMVSQKLFGNQITSIDSIIEECFSESVFNHSKFQYLPVLNHKRELHIRHDDRFEIYTGGNATYPKDVEMLSLRRCIPRINLLRGNEKKGLINKYTNYDNLILADKLIITSNSSSKLDYLSDDNENIIKLGSAKVATASYENYTIIDRFKEIDEAIKIAGSI